MKSNQLIQLAVASVCSFFGVLSVSGQTDIAAYEAFAKEAKGKTVIVTGSNRGQGLGWVESYLASGDSVIATCRKPEKAEELQALAEKHGAKLLIEQLDVTNEEHQKALGEKLSKSGVMIDLAISNAGVTVKEDFGSWTKKGFDFNFGVNTVGAALFAQAIAPQLKEGSKLIQISSGAGSIHYQKKSNDLDAYCASKAALNMLTKKLSYALADQKVIVVAMTPGMVLTDMNPEGTSTVEEAIVVLRATVEALTPEQNGMFMNKTGKKMPW